MATEIERKWLVPDLPGDAIAGHRADAIDQGYLVIGEDGSETRLRRNADDLTLTYKSGGGISRTEIVVELTPEQFDALWPATEGRRVEKQRVTLEDGLEVDIYGGALDGLVVAEHEFDSEAAAGAYEPPTWCAGEVTEDRAYKNQQLALRGRPQV